MTEHSSGDDNDVNWNTDDELEIDNFQLSPSSSPRVHSVVEQAGASSQNVAHMGISDGDDNDMNWNTDEEIEIDNFHLPPSSSTVHHSMIGQAGTSSQNVAHMRISDESVAMFIEMGYSAQMIGKAIDENGGPNSEPSMILETLLKYSTNAEASSSRSKVIDHLIAMGFPENAVIKAVHEYGEENIDDITNALLSYAEAEKLRVTEDEDINMLDNTDDDNLYSGLLSSDEENGLNSSHEDQDGRLQALIEMDYSRQDASLAIERCEQDASVGELVDFICAAQMAREFDVFSAIPDEEQPLINSKKRQADNESSRRERNLNSVMASRVEFIRLPNPMIGFGVPNKPGILTQRPVPIPDFASGPPYFYYENVARATKGVWAKMTSQLYDIMPEFVDSKYFCAANRKRGYIHNLPIKNRFQIQPLPYLTIEEALPLTKTWWPTWDERRKLNCILTCIGSVQPPETIRVELEKYDGEPPLRVQKDIIKKCKMWNLIWVGKNKVAPLEPDEIENLLGFPRDHTRGVTRTDRYKSLGNSFQVDTVAYHLSVLKPLFRNGINVLSLFTGIGGAEVALHRLQIPMNVVVSVEISQVSRSILRSFWKQTNQRGVLREFEDVRKLDDHMIEQLMDKYGAFDLVIGGSPCNNLAGGNRVSRTGLEGEQSSLFYDYCRILHTVRQIAARMRR